MTHNPDNPFEHLPEWQRRKIRKHAPMALALATGPLEWQSGSRWHLVSGCGYYTVAKALVKGTPSYGAWHRPTGRGLDIPVHLGERATADEAKALAQMHADLARAGPLGKGRAAP